MTETDWDRSAQAWIASMGDAGDLARAHVLDQPMLAHAEAAGAKSALDVGCGEGRFCRMLQKRGMHCTGIDPTQALLDHAAELDPVSTYLNAKAEALPFKDANFDLVVSYLSLIDIPDYRTAITEMARVLKPGGMLLAANLQSFATAIPRDWPEDQGGWVTEGHELLYWVMDDYMTERAETAAWKDIRITNWHRPLSAYMAAFLGEKLTLISFEEPPYTGTSKERAESYHRAPWVYLSAWLKPELNA